MVQFVLPDSHAGVAGVGEGGVDFPRYGVTDAAPTATITIDRRVLDDVMLGQAQFPALLQSGAIRVGGDRAAFLSWFAQHPPADPRFNIIVPSGPGGLSKADARNRRPSRERRVGNECVLTCRSSGGPCT